MRKLPLLTPVIGVILVTLSMSGGSNAAQDHPTDAAFPTQCVAEVCVADTTPNDPMFHSQYGPQRIAAPAAWDITTGVQTTVIATVDTGIDCTHPDLVGKCTAGYNFISGVPLSGTENSDDYGHGTHVTSIEAGDTNNNVGVAGLCWQCRYMPVKVLDSGGSGSWAGVASGIRFAADNGASVINMSLGGTTFDAGVSDAVDYAFAKGVLVVSACGNDGTGTCLYPAAYTNSMAVSCSDSGDTICSFSSRGPEVDVSAPGLSVLAAVPTGACPLCDPSGYRVLSGTSMSTPHVSGTAGLIRSLHPEYTADQVYGLLEQASDDRGSVGFDSEYGFGRVNALQGVTQAAPSGRLTKPIPPPTPTLVPTPTPSPCNNSTSFSGTTGGGNKIAPSFSQNIASNCASITIQLAATGNCPAKRGVILKASDPFNNLISSTGFCGATVSFPCPCASGTYTWFVFVNSGRLDFTGTVSY